VARPLQFPAVRSQRRRKRDDKMKITTKAGLKVRANLKAGGFGPPNHNRGSLKVRTTIKAGGFGPPNHNRAAIKVRSGVKAGSMAMKNHSVNPLLVS
jgi:hypothetical protein